jgi:hypothetical protein
MPAVEVPSADPEGPQSLSPLVRIGLRRLQNLTDSREHPRRKRVTAVRLKLKQNQLVGVIE